MAKEKVYKLAKEFKVSSEALVQMLRGMGITVKSHMSTVDENLRDQIKQKFEQERAEIKKQYVMHGVTGPNEYENNVNNNWYTNKIAVWCLKFTIESLNFVKETEPAKYNALHNKIQYKTEAKSRA